MECKKPYKAFKLTFTTKISKLVAIIQNDLAKPIAILIENDQRNLVHLHYSFLQLLVEPVLVHPLDDLQVDEFYSERVLGFQQRESI